MHVSRFTVLDDVAAKIPFLSESKPFVHLGDGGIGRQDLAAQLVELESLENMLEDEVFDQAAYPSSAESFLGDIKRPVAPLMSRVDVVQVGDSDILPAPGDDPIAHRRVVHHPREPAFMLLNPDVVVGKLVQTHTGFVPPPPDLVSVVGTQVPHLEHSHLRVVITLSRQSAVYPPSTRRFWPVT